MPVTMESQQPRLLGGNTGHAAAECFCSIQPQNGVGRRTRGANAAHGFTGGSRPVGSLP
jgi:hypothetical protein